MFCGYKSDYKSFSTKPVDDIVRELKLFIPDAGLDQVRVWRQTIPTMQNQVTADLAALGAAGASNSVILEYELPREGGRRPDLVLLRDGAVVVVEYKSASTPRRDDLDQVIAYARDLEHYHSATHGRTVIPILALDQYKKGVQNIDGVLVTDQRELADVLGSLGPANPSDSIDLEVWVKAEYEPLPGLVEAARRIFNDEPLPQIKRARAARIPETVDLIIDLVQEAKQSGSRKLILLSGVPGAGKTLVGLQVVHDDRMESFGAGSKGHAAATFLSGNGPLVRVLQDALGTGTLVGDMKKFVTEYAFKRHDVEPPNHVVVFDEAQRAWDREQMEKKHGDFMSEPEALMNVMERTSGWGVVLGLVGEGQEIHSGEEGGIDNWIDAVMHSSRKAKWEAHGSEKVARAFAKRGASVTGHELLNLDLSLRSHLASELHEWVAQIVGEGDADSDELADRVISLRKQGFSLYVTRDIDLAREYIRNRYSGMQTKKYGLLASRYTKNLEPIGLDNKFHFERAKQLDVAKWFNLENDDSLSSCALSRPATEFECQGLELDLPVVCWGTDFFREDGSWKINPRLGHRVKDKLQVRTNAYRVLLSRGRDGLIIFVPKSEDLNETFDYFLQTGIPKLHL
ncbi:MAG: hypothetical protein CMI30_08510 [Opitutae bacterium]|nr:hypothetical protein [Opitutae bacterium]|tara:strand:- start:2219 stop:4099 length:1881 start_codon:yes stop_codon:yes gene_type:complete